MSPLAPPFAFAAGTGAVNDEDGANVADEADEADAFDASGTFATCNRTQNRRKFSLSSVPVAYTKNSQETNKLETKQDLCTDLGNKTCR